MPGNYLSGSRHCPVGASVENVGGSANVIFLRNLPGQQAEWRRAEQPVNSAIARMRLMRR